MKGCGELWEGEQWCGATVFFHTINIDRKYMLIKYGLEIPFTIGMYPKFITP